MLSRNIKFYVFCLFVCLSGCSQSSCAINKPFESLMVNLYEYCFCKKEKKERIIKSTA